jgi:hypothetical protein
MSGVNIPEVQALLATIAEKEIELRALIARTNEQERILRHNRDLESGEYYTPMEVVWSSKETVECSEPRMFEEMRRERAPTLGRRGQWLRLARTPDDYSVILKNSLPSPLRQAALGDSHVSVEREEVLLGPTDLYGSPNFCSETAHLIPGSDNRANSYSDVARCVLALQDDAPHDIKQENQSLKLPVAGYDDDAKTVEFGERVSNTHFQPKFAFLARQCILRRIPVFSFCQS